MNPKIALGILLGVLLAVFLVFGYYVFFKESSEDISVPERILRAVGFEPSDTSSDTPALPLPSDGNSYPGGGGSGGGGSGGGSSGSGSQVLSFCTFDAYHTITSPVPCRCGFSGVCTETEATCDATFNNGQGNCE